MICPSCQAENEPAAAECGRCGETLAVTETTPIVVSVDLRPGTVFHNRYEILAPLGQGGMGMVYKARDRSLDEVVAIKVLRPDFGKDPRMADRFKSEIRLARRIRHRNVCGIHDYGEDQGLLYISMEYIEGVDLKHLIRQRGVFAPEDAYDLAIQVAEGLQAVHDAGIIHRDLKTPNIMRDSDGVARLMDFGIAKRKGGETLTATGHIVGTPEYMSPEQAQGHRVDFRSDIYALGIVIYEIFTGKVPFRGETPISTILKHINEPPPLDGPQAARLPDELRPVLRRCLAKESKDRYASATELAEALRNARSPSRRQVPMPTEVLRAPTTPAAPAVRAPRPTVQPWQLAVPLVVVVAGAVMLKGQLGVRPAAPAPSPVTLEAAPTPAATVAAVSAPGAAPTPPIEVASAGNEPATKGFADTPPAKAAAAPPTSPAGFGVAARPLRPSPRPVPAPSPVAATRPATPAPTPVPAPPTAAPALPAVAEGPGLLQVAVKPWGEVAVDGRVVGTTPIDRITLPSGTHTVRVRHPLYEPWERTVTIRGGQLERVLVDLPAMGVKKQD